MFIMTQDGARLVSLGTGAVIEAADGAVVMYGPQTGFDSIELGEYGTDERAREELCSLASKLQVVRMPQG